MKKPTPETYSDLDRAYRVYNKRLFNNTLPPVLLTLRARGKALSHFRANQFAQTETGQICHEIQLNPSVFATFTIETCMSLLVREMVAMELYLTKKSPHGKVNAAFADRMEELGLVTSTTGMPGGHRTGGKRTKHYIHPQGLFLRVTRKLLTERFMARWADRHVDLKTPEWAPGKPARIQHNLGASEASDRQKQALAVGAAPGNWPEPPEDALGRYDHIMKDLVRTAQPGGKVPPLARMPSVFIVKDMQPRRDIDLSKVKFKCDSCSQAAWGTYRLEISCSKCHLPMRSALS